MRHRNFLNGLSENVNTKNRSWFQETLKSNVSGKETHLNNEAISLYDIAPTSFHNTKSQGGMSYKYNEIPQL